MRGWTSEDLARIGGAEELQLASHRPNGSLRQFVTMWVVRAGDDLYVRSAYGPDNHSYRRARATARVAFEPAVSSATWTSPKPRPPLTRTSMPPITGSTIATAPESWAAWWVRT